MEFHFNVPNVLTFSRLLLAPVLAVLFLYDSEPGRYVILMIIIISELTDALDGYYARKYGMVTDLGKILDPMTDSIYRDTIFLSLAIVGEVHFLLVLPIIYRDSIISSLRTMCAYEGIVVAARSSGKLKAIIQAIVIFIIVILRIAALYIPDVQTNLYTITNVLMALVCLVTVVSAVDYIRNLTPHLKKDA